MALTKQANRKRIAQYIRYALAQLKAGNTAEAQKWLERAAEETAGDWKVS